MFSPEAVAFFMLKPIPDFFIGDAFGIFKNFLDKEEKEALKFTYLTHVKIRDLKRIFNAKFEECCEINPSERKNLLDLLKETEFRLFPKPLGVRPKSLPTQRRSFLCACFKLPSRDRISLAPQRMRPLNFLFYDVAKIISDFLPTVDAFYLSQLTHTFHQAFLERALTESRFYLGRTVFSKDRLLSPERLLQWKDCFRAMRTLESTATPLTDHALLLALSSTNSPARG